MSRSIDRLRNKKATGVLGVTIGDADSTRTIANIVAELGTAGAGMYADKQKKDEAAAAAAKLANSDAGKAKVEASNADKAAAFAEADAMAETDPNGPKHAVAKQMRAAANVAAAKYAYWQQGGTSPAGAQAAAAKAGEAKPSIFTPMNIAIALGVGGLGFLAYRKFKR
jgi:hypothetical protein